MTVAARSASLDYAVFENLVFLMFLVKLRNIGYILACTLRRAVEKCFLASRKEATQL